MTHQIFVLLSSKQPKSMELYERIPANAVVHYLSALTSNQVRGRSIGRIILVGLTVDDIPGWLAADLEAATSSYRMEHEQDMVIYETLEVPRSLTLEEKLSALGLTEAQRLAVFQILVEGTRVTVDVDNNFILSASDVEIVLSSQTENSPPMIHDFELYMDGVNSQQVISCKIPELRYDSSSLFSLELEILPLSATLGWPELSAKLEEKQRGRKVKDSGPRQVIIIGLDCLPNDPKVMHLGADLIVWNNDEGAEVLENVSIRNPILLYGVCVPNIVPKLRAALTKSLTTDLQEFHQARYADNTDCVIYERTVC